MVLAAGFQASEPRAVGDDNHAMPKCPRELCEIEQNLVALDCCPGCNGLWFDRGELEKLARIDDVFSKLDKGVPVESVELSCPRCANALSKHATEETIGVSIERCPDCGGIWLDRAELAAFKKRARPKRTERPRAPEARPRKPEVLTMKEFLLKFVNSSIERLRED